MIKVFTATVFGIIAGIWIDQNYAMPSVSTLVNFAMGWLRTFEENLRK